MRIRVALLSAFVVACSGGQDPITTSTAAAETTSTTSVSTTTQPPTTAAPTTTTTALAALQGLQYELVQGDLPFPIYFSPRVDGTNFLITKAGQVWEQTEDGFSEFLDIRDRVGSEANEQGLLGMAWHPSDPERLFLHYTDTNGDTVISEFSEGEERVMLQVDQPARNHNGGMIAFGPDGYLYIGLGDGGGAADQFGTGQPVDDLLGSLLRIDVEGDPYAIPPGNPYADSDGADEVWASGLRNPWRFWFDEGLVYIGDVGQNAFEEINVSPAEAAGLNYGWPITEGLHCFSPARGCDVSGLTLPVLEVDHGDGGTCSITGGVVYRGESIPELFGHYLYSDYCGGWLRSFRYQSGEAVSHTDWTNQVGVPGPVVSFGTDAAGEVYVLTTDAVYRITARR